MSSTRADRGRCVCWPSDRLSWFRRLLERQSSAGSLRNTATSAKAAGPAWRPRMSSGEPAGHLGTEPDRDPREPGCQQRHPDTDRYEGQPRDGDGRGQGTATHDRPGARDPWDHSDGYAEHGAARRDDQCLTGGNAASGMPGGPHCGKGRHVVLGLGEREGCGDERGDQHEQPGDQERDEQDQPEWVLEAALDLEKGAVAESVGHGTLYLRGDRAGGRGEVKRLDPDWPAKLLGRVRQYPGA